MRYHFGLRMLIAFACMGSPACGQMVDGRDIPEFGKTFNVDAKQTDFPVAAYLIHSTAPGNILWPNDSLALTLQIHNKSGVTVSVQGALEMISYATRGRRGDIWVPEMFRVGQLASLPLRATVPAHAFVNLVVRPAVPALFGAYGFVVDLGAHGRQFITSVARTYAFPRQRIQYPAFCLDDHSNDVLQRLGVHAIRHGVDYHPTTDPDFETWYQQERERMLAYSQADISVLVKMSAPTAYGKLHPLGMPRPWLDQDGVMQNTKTDMAWLPAYDDDFKKLVYRLAVEFGWPKGPVNAFALWNEPWEGVSISGWGADIQRYREIYTKMAEAVEEARRDAGVDVLVGGCSSTSNALDKLFADGQDTFLDRFDFCSIHYQGMSSSATIKKWVNRKSERGRVKIWDTESWVANVDDRVAAVVATNRSAGYDRAMGIYFGNICHVVPQPYFAADGTIHQTDVTHAWSVAPAIGATQHFIGERSFEKLLFTNGLPWISVFKGLDGNPDDGTLVVVGDIGEAFGADHVLFRTARGLEEQRHEEALKKQIAGMDARTQQDAIARLQAQIDHNEVLAGATLTLGDGGGKFQLYDFYGNRVASENSTITIPLDGRGFFLRTDGSSGSFDALVTAVNAAAVKGIEPLETVALDFTAPLHTKPDLTLKLTNVLNRHIEGKLNVALEGIALEKPTMALKFKPHETRWVKLKVRSATAEPSNSYPVSLVFDAGTDGKAMHTETLHVNVIAKRHITVDASLDDWAGVLPQVVKGEGGGNTSLTEAAWFPFKNFENNQSGGIVSGYLAYDAQYFYFAAKISDTSPDEGMRRFETLDADEFFYPQTSFIPYNGFRFGGAMKHDGTSFSARWTGAFRPVQHGSVTFFLAARGRARLWLDDKLVIDAWERPLNDGVVLKLDKGKTYRLRAEFSTDNGGSMQLQWQSKKMARQVIAAPNFPGGLKGEFYNGPVFNVLRVTRQDTAIDFSWKQGEVPDPAFLRTPNIELSWPQGVRRYSYRKDTETPSGNFADHDNVQIAFNVLSDDEKELYPYVPGTMKGYVNYQCTDYEYALNPVAARYGGGVECWRSKVPGMPHKHFFPRQMPSPFDGPVRDARLAFKRDGHTRYVEAAIPWSEIPHVKKRLDERAEIKFSFRVNDNTPHGCMELARKRSVSKINGSFKVDWKEHWANEVSFAFE